MAASELRQHQGGLPTPCREQGTSCCCADKVRLLSENHQLGGFLRQGNSKVAPASYQGWD